jgi:Flp pilus assembly protein TadB
MVFGKKKKIEKAERKAEETKREEIKRALKVTEIQMPGKEEFTPYTSEYLTFLEELKQKPTTWYEKACAFAEKIFPVTPDEKTKIKIDDALKAGYTNATAKGTFSFAILTTLIVLIIVFYCIAFLDIGMIFGIFSIITVLGTFWYFFNYPEARAKSMGIKMSSDSVLAILYMIIYMEHTPNLELATWFAAKHLPPPLSLDFIKVLWDVETKTFTEHDVENKYPFYQFRIKSLDDIENGTEKITNY